LDCRIFALTDDEPFVHPAFSSIITKLLSYRDSYKEGERLRRVP
jgi:hypothetical protein